MNNSEDNSEVVIVHGLWFGAWAMRLLARRLKLSNQESGPRSVRRFSYRSTRGTLDQHARALHQYLEQRQVSSRHLVAHSLGGLVILRMFTLFPHQRPGRIVFLGSPLRGSHVARKAHRIPGVRRLLGQAQPDLEQGYSELPPYNAAGMIAGTRRFGLGLFVGELRTAGDGTVALEETRVDGLAAYVTVSVTHTGLVISKKVAMLVNRFLETGAFKSAD